MVNNVTNNTIIRKAKGRENPYFQMPRAVAQNRELSYEAIGLLTYILSKPDDWQVMFKDLQRKGCGRDRTKRIIEELISAGYIIHTFDEDHPKKDEQGRWSRKAYIVSDSPFTENPSTGEPSTVNPHLHNRDNTNERITEKTKAPHPPKNRQEDDAESETPAPLRGEGKPSKSQTRRDSATPAAQINPMKDAIAESFGKTDWGRMTKTERGMIQRTAKELCEAGYEPKDVQVIYDWCKAQGWNGFSPVALTKYASAARASRQERLRSEYYMSLIPDDFGLTRESVEAEYW